MPTPNEISKRILGKEREREVLWSEIQHMAKAHIPDYHFLDWRVSVFWTCKDSPIGMCVFPSEARCFNENISYPLCRYCNQPTERK